MWCEWGYEMLEASRNDGQNIYGLPAMKPLIEFGMIFRVEITKLKVFLEIFLGTISVFLLFTGRIAPIFPIFFWQYLRIKYLISTYMIVVWRDIDIKFFKRVIPGTIYQYTVEPFKKKVLAYFVDYK